jgi:hypothetical protein
VSDIAGELVAELPGTFKIVLQYGQLQFLPTSSSGTLRGCWQEEHKILIGINVNRESWE